MASLRDLDPKDGTWVQDGDGNRYKVCGIYDDDAILECESGLSVTVPIKGPLARDDYRLVKHEPAQ